MITYFHMVDMISISEQSERRINMGPNTMTINICVNGKMVTFNNVKEYEIHHSLLSMELTDNTIISYNLNDIEYFEEKEIRRED